MTGGDVDHSKCETPLQHLRILIEQQGRAHVVWSQAVCCAGMATAMKMDIDRKQRTPLTADRATQMGKDRLCTTPELKEAALVECGHRIGNVDIENYDQMLTLHKSAVMKVNWLAVTTHPQLSSAVHAFASFDSSPERRRDPASSS